MTQLALVFCGPDVARQDAKRLGKQLRLVKGVMGSGEWFTLARLSALTGAPEASVSARIRDLDRLFGIKHERRRVRPAAGQWEYRLLTGRPVSEAAP